MNRLWQPSTFEADLGGFLSELAHGPTLTYAAWKLTVNRSVLLELDGYTDYERQLANLIRTTEDHTEGRVSFREKRAARYVGQREAILQYKNSRGQQTSSCRRLRPRLEDR